MTSTVGENDTAPIFETDQRPYINISNVHGNIMIGHNSKLLSQADARANEEGETMAHNPYCNNPDARQISEECPVGERPQPGVRSKNGLGGNRCHRARAQPISGVAPKRVNPFNSDADTSRSIMGPLPPIPSIYLDQQIQGVGSEREKCLNGDSDTYPSTKGRPIQYRSRAQQIRKAEPERENCSYGDVYTGRSRHEPWCPKPNRRITNYPPKRNGTILKTSKEFVQDVDRQIEEVLKASHEDKKYIEQFLVHDVLPKIEKLCTQDSTCADATVTLAKLGCAGISDSVTTHALELLHELVSHNKLNRHADKLQLIEQILRRSILSTNGERKEKLERRVIIYSHILILLLIETEKNGHPFYFSIEDENELRKGVVAKLEKLFGMRQVYKKKPQLQLALDVVFEALKRLFSTSISVSEQHETFLQEFTPFLEQQLDPKQTEEKWKKLQKKLSNTNNVWFDVVMLLHYINAQETMCPKNTVIMLCKLINEYMTVSDRCRVFKTKTHHNKNGVFLAAISVLFDIAMEQKRRDVRKDATLSLADYRTAASNPLVTETIERYVGMCLFGQDTDIRTLLAYHLFDAHNPDQEIPQQYMENFLEWFYRLHSLEIIKTMSLSASNTANSCHFTRRGVFRGIPSVVKILKLNVKEISQPGTVAPSKAQRDLINEAYSLNKLNADPHPNVLRVLAFNTTKPPYHVITEYMSKGTVREYLQSCWSENNFLPSQSSLIQICRDVTEAARFIRSRVLVHRGLTADNSFIGEDDICKVAGTATVQPLSLLRKVSEASEEETYITPVDCCAPEYISKDEDYPLTHAAPECIKEGRFSTASDVYGIGVFMWEVFTYGCPAFSRTKDGIRIPEVRHKIKQRILEGKKLPKENCFHDEIYSLMESCWMTNPAERPSLDKLLQKFDRLHSDYSGIAEYERPPANPPTCRFSKKLNRLHSPPRTPQYEVDLLEFPASSSSEPTSTKKMGKEPLYDNNTTMIGLCKPQEMKKGASGYMPLIPNNGGEYKSLDPSTQNANPIPVPSGEQISSGKPPVPKKPQSPSAPNTRKVDMRDTTNERSSPLRPSSLATPLKKSSKDNYEDVSAADDIAANLDKNTSSVYQRVKSLGTQVLPAGFKPRVLGQCNTTVEFEVYDDCVTKASNPTVCHGYDTSQRDIPDNEFTEDDSAYCEIVDGGEIYERIWNENSHIYNDATSTVQRTNKGRTI